jgi:predicted AAA+ superfamily ATPase
MTRGGRSGRVAWQFVQDLAGRLGKTLDADCPTDRMDSR